MQHLLTFLGCRDYIACFLQNLSKYVINKNKFQVLKKVQVTYILYMACTFFYLVLRKDLKMNEILNYFPIEIRKNLQHLDFSEIEEIRLRVTKPIILRCHNEEKIIPYLVNKKDLVETLKYICDGSIYSYQNQICSGYITIKGGHRVGISR